MKADFSASTGLYFDLPMVEAVKRISNLGFKYVELYRHTWEFDDITQELKRIFKGGTIKPVAWHDHHELVFWADGKGGDVYSVVKQVKQRLDICAELDVPLFTMHYDFAGYAGHEDDSPRKHPVFDAIPEIAAYARARGITILFENTGIRSDFIRRLCDEAADPNIGICLDIGHANIFEDIETGVANVRPYLKCLHISDNFGRRKDGGFSDLHLAPGEGSIDWRKCMGLLKNADYNGVLNFELNGSQYARDGVADTMGFGNYLRLKERDRLLRAARAHIGKFLKVD